MHVLNESAAPLYIIHCNVTLILILVHFINDVYVFGLRMSLWRRFFDIVKKEIKLCVQDRYCF